jgi:hypothetical protein
MRVDARYLTDVALREAASIVPGVHDLQAQIRRGSPASTHFLRIRLGELVAEGLTEVQRRDREAIEQEMRRAARDLVPLSAAPVEEVAARTALLVDRRRVNEVEGAIDELAARHAHRLQFRLLGPMAPWDFVALPSVSAATRRTGTR